MNVENTPPEIDASGYLYTDAEVSFGFAYIVPGVLKALKRIARPGDRIFEIGCGNGSTANAISEQGYSISGVEPSRDGVVIANRAFPHLEISEGSGYDDLAAIYGTFPLVMCLEVVEHVYAPRLLVRRCYDLIEPGGYFLISTPFHGYWKNLAMAITGKLDRHFTALWDHGHIKFWSVRTMSVLLKEAGLEDLQFVGLGRFPLLARSMLVVARKPLQSAN